MGLQRARHLLGAPSTSRTAPGLRGGCTELPCDPTGLSVSLQSPQVYPGVALRAPVGAGGGGGGQMSRAACPRLIREAFAPITLRKRQTPEQEYLGATIWGFLVGAKAVVPSPISTRHPHPHPASCSPNLWGRTRAEGPRRKLSSGRLAVHPGLCAHLHTARGMTRDPQGFILLDLEDLECVTSHQLLVLTDHNVVPNAVPPPELGVRLPEGRRGG